MCSKKVNPLHDLVCALFIFTHPTRKGLCGNAYKFHQQINQTRRRKYAFNVRTGLVCNRLPVEIVNTSSVKPIKMLLGAKLRFLSPGLPIYQISYHNPFPLHTWPRLGSHTRMALFTYHTAWLFMEILTVYLFSVTDLIWSYNESRA